MIGSVLTLEECAKELKVSLHQVSSLIENGELSARKIGTDYRIPVASFQEYLGISVPFAENNIKFSNWADKWLEIYKKPNVTINTYEGTYLLYTNKHLKPFFGNMFLKDIKPSDVQLFYASKRELSESALNKIRICLNAIFQTAIDNNLCLKNPTNFVAPKSNQSKRKKRFYSAQQEKEVREFSINKMPGIVLCLETGLRPGEFTGLRWSDIQDGVLYVNRSIAYSKTEGYIIRPPKWNSYRQIPLTPIAKIALQKMLNHDIYVFPREKNMPYTPRAWDKIVSRFFQRTPFERDNIPILTPHEFRHTFGTKLRRNGVDIYTIQKLMGHKTIKVTTETYVHNEIDILKRAMGL